MSLFSRKHNLDTCGLAMGDLVSYADGVRLVGQNTLISTFRDPLHYIILHAGHACIGYTPRARLLNHWATKPEVCNQLVL